MTSSKFSRRTRIQAEPPICKTPPVKPPTTPPPPPPRDQCLYCAADTTPYSIRVDIYGFVAPNAWINGIRTLVQESGTACRWIVYETDPGGNLVIYIRKRRNDSQANIALAPYSAAFFADNEPPNPCDCMAWFPGQRFSIYTCNIPGGNAAKIEVLGVI